MSNPSPGVELAQVAALEKKFKVEAEDLASIVTGYQQRAPDKWEDLRLTAEMGGLEGIAKVLKTDLKDGLTGTDNAERRSHFGSNMRPPAAVRGFCKIMWDVLGDTLLRVLFFCGIISIAIDEATQDDKAIAWIDGFGMILAVAIVTLVSSFNDWQKEKQFQELNKKAEQSKEILYLKKKEGVAREILTKDPNKSSEIVSKHEGQIVVGDIMILQQGKAIPADGLLIEGQDVACDESSMTGESNDCKKDVLATCQKKLQQMLNQGRAISDYELHEIPSPILLSGSQVKTGTGRFLVIAVGSHSCVGKVLASLRDKPTMTPLQKKLEGIADSIGKVGLYAAILTVAVLFIRYFASRIIYGDWKASDVGDCFGYVVLGITVLIVAIPEGLPLAVTIALAYSVTKMFDEGNLVKTLMSCEVMGNANYICSDKTGTLTKNDMDVVKIWYAKNDLPVRTVDEHGKPVSPTEGIDPEGLSLIVDALAFNVLKEQGGLNATEKACLKYLTQAGFDAAAIERKHVVNKRFLFNSDRKIMSSIVELDSSLHRLYMKGAPEKIFSRAKYYYCRNGDKDCVKPLTEEARADLDMQITAYNREALRTIAVAYRDLRPDEFGPQHDEQTPDGKYLAEEDKLTIICILGIRDTLRDGVQLSVEQCGKAGIKVIMVTGDNVTTARAIAENCKILEKEDLPIGAPPPEKRKDDYSVMDGEAFSIALGGLIRYCTNCNVIIEEAEFKKYKEQKAQEEKKKKTEEKKEEKKEEEEGDGDDDEEEAEIEKQEQQDECPKCQNKKVVEKVKNMPFFKEHIYPKLRVLARSRPLDKLLLVTALKELGNTVAVTGDGTNDAPALKRADVGFAMGKAGTDIAKSAADIILLEDTFDSIVTAVKWGRNIYDSIQKFIQFQLSVNIVALVVAFIGSCVVSKSPLSPLQLIWVNIIMDSLASLALATDPPTLELLNRLPHAKDESIMSKKMLKHILGQSLYMIIVIMIILFAGEYFIPEEDIIVNGYPISHNGYVRTGRVADYEGHTDGDHIYNKDVLREVGPSRHFTVLFTTFVFLHIVNEWNCRKLYDELNIFSGIEDNRLSIVVRILETIIQAIISQFGGRVFDIYRDGMTWYQWLICIGFSLGSLFVRLILLLIPEGSLTELGNKQLDPFARRQSALDVRRRSATFGRRASIPKGDLVVNKGDKRLSAV